MNRINPLQTSVKTFIGSTLQITWHITGTITKLIDRDANGITDGFDLKVAGLRDPLTVLLEADAPVFGVDGKSATPDALLVGKGAWARGRLEVEGKFRAPVAVVGQVLTTDGVAKGSVVADVFPFQPEAGKEIVGDPNVNVRLFQDQSLVFRGCDTEVGWDAIAQDVPARVFGKLSMAEPELRAAVVLLRRAGVAGTVTAFFDPGPAREDRPRSPRRAVRTRPRGSA